MGKNKNFIIRQYSGGQEINSFKFRGELGTTEGDLFVGRIVAFEVDGRAVFLTGTVLVKEIGDDGSEQ